MKRRKNDEAFRCLERAHVLGQQDVVPHVLAHWLMLKLAFVNRDTGAVFGQALRIVLGAIGSAVGVVPKGNTGGTNVGMFRRMPITPELAKLMSVDAVSGSPGAVGSRCTDRERAA